MIDSAAANPHQRRMRWMVIIGLLFWSAMAQAEPPQRLCSSGKWGHAHCIRPQYFVYDTCNAIRVFADRHALDRDFLARLIWQESRFDPNAVSPADARGIAQFIPSTARLRGLADPFNPADALEHAAHYLAEMTERFGNEGLAAVGYNGGETRARSFVSGGTLAPETQAYVPLITGVPAEMWRDTPPETHDMRLSRTEGFHKACVDLAAGRRLSPPPRQKLERPKSTLKPWGVQIAFGTSEKRVRARMRGRRAVCRAFGSGEKVDFTYEENRVAGKTGYYYAQFGRTTKARAQQLCKAMRAEDCLCLVVQN